MADICQVCGAGAAQHSPNSHNFVPIPDAEPASANPNDKPLPDAITALGGAGAVAISGTARVPRPPITGNGLEARAQLNATIGELLDRLPEVLDVLDGIAELHASAQRLVTQLGAVQLAANVGKSPPPTVETVQLPTAQLAADRQAGVVAPAASTSTGHGLFEGPPGTAPTGGQAEEPPAPALADTLPGDPTGG